MGAAEQPVAGPSSQGAAKPNRKKQRPQQKPRMKTNELKRVKNDAELKDLQDKIDNFKAPQDLTLFSQLPLSARTQKGLKQHHFMTPTPIQALSIPESLKGRDVLGSAKTGSGKTIAFLLPMLERLYLAKWGPLDGLGAVVISPTRELAIQTFNQLRQVGQYHTFSAGLVIGGKGLKEERDRLSRMNILIATPGRLLQHLDSTVGMDSSSVKCLVLDEADRLLDLGFLPALRAILSHFTPFSPSGPTNPTLSAAGRQTLLFSATQSKDLAALAKLSLHEPLYINCNKPGEEGIMPAGLEQYYAVVPLERKLDALWGFVKSHLKMKGVVFVTSGKQVRFIFETFRRLHPGLPLLHLHGKQKQPTRLDIFQRFSASPNALLICTDIASRGLDFPKVDWVIQLDCPDDVDTYIHRVGRTARYDAKGKALLLLCPSEEEGMTKRWVEKGIDCQKIKIKESKMGSLAQQMQGFAFREPEIKYLGQRAFISYMRSIYIQSDKTVFKFSELPAEAYAASMGLPGAPQIKFADNKASKKAVRGGAKKEEEKQPEIEDMELGASSDEDEEEDEDEVEQDDDDVVSGDDGEASVGSATDNSDGESDEKPREKDDDKPAYTAPAVRTKYDRMFERKNQSILTPHYTNLIGHDDDLLAAGIDEDDDFITLKRRDHDLDGTIPDPEAPMSTEDMSKRKLRMATSKKAMAKNGPLGTKVVFNDDGEARDFYEMGEKVEEGAAAEEKRLAFVRAEQERMKVADQEDREVAREKRREKKRKRKEREREIDGDGSDDEPVAYLGGGSDMGSEDGGFDVGSAAESNAGYESPDEPAPVAKKSKRSQAPADDMEDEESLALRLLQGS